MIQTLTSCDNYEGIIDAIRSYLPNAEVAVASIIRELTPRKPRPGASRSYVRQGRRPGAML